MVAEFSNRAVVELREGFMSVEEATTRPYESLSWTLGAGRKPRACTRPIRGTL